MKWLTSTSSGATSSAICRLLPMAMPRESSMRFFSASMTAVLCSAALPTMATTITPMKMLVMPKAFAASSTEPTRISLIQTISRVAPARVSMARFRLHAAGERLPGALLSGEELLVRAQREDQVQRVGRQQHERDAQAEVDLRARSAPGPAREWKAAGITSAIAARVSRVDCARAPVDIEALGLVFESAGQHGGAEAPAACCR